MALRSRSTHVPAWAVIGFISSAIILLLQAVLYNFNLYATLVLGVAAVGALFLGCFVAVVAHLFPRVGRFFLLDDNSNTTATVQQPPRRRRAVAVMFERPRSVYRQPDSFVDAELPPYEAVQRPPPSVVRTATMQELDRQQRRRQQQQQQQQSRDSEWNGQRRIWTEPLANFQRPPYDAVC